MCNSTTGFGSIHNHTPTAEHFMEEATPNMSSHTYTDMVCLNGLFVCNLPPLNIVLFLFLCSFVVFIVTPLYSFSISVSP